MENREGGIYFIILSVIALTVYNILPTLFYYTEPLKQPSSEVEGKDIAVALSRRVDGIEKDSLDWLGSFCELIQVSPSLSL